MQYDEYIVKIKKESIAWSDNVDRSMSIIREKRKRIIYNPHLLTKYT